MAVVKRFAGYDYKLPLIDQFVSAAILVAQANGVAAAGHVKSELV